MRVWPYEEPWATNYQRQSDEAFAVAESATAEQLRNLKPPLPQIVYAPRRFGYPSYARRQWGVLDVFGIDRLPSGRIPGVPQMHGEDRVDYTRSQSVQQGSDRLTNGGDPLGLGGAGW